MRKAPSSHLVTALTYGSALALCLTLAACGHKAVPPPPPPAPPPAAAPAPTVTLQADPTAVESGAASTLTWASTNATGVELNGTAVNLNGSQQVTPSQSTDYEVVAKNADGQTANASVRVTVTQPPPPPPPPAPVAKDLGTFEENVRDAFFDYDKSDIRPDAETLLQTDAQYLKANPDTNIQIIGHCDARGSAEYNLALGDRRAQAVKNYLVSQGIDASRITTTSVGKEQPFCTETTDDCYQLNRRGHFTKGN
ncbi:MAG TPA: OmpA family protein [Terriglobales bacterium]|nr:OmpA family protein [Terriglobales bacterium]